MKNWILLASFAMFLSTHSTGAAPLPSGYGVGRANDPADHPVPANYDAIVAPRISAPQIDLTAESAPQRIQATFTVTTTADAVPGSLRAAITSANASPGLDLIAFAVGSGPLTLAPGSRLPDIVDPIVIDGTTQPGFSGNPIVELSGASAGSNAIGLVIQAGGSTVRGLIINRWLTTGSGGFGIVLDALGNNVIEGCWIGLAPDGMNARPNAVNGILIVNGSTNNRIGGTTAAQRNVLSGNSSSGIQIGTGNGGFNTILGNWIGLNAFGTGILPNNGNGIFLNASDNTIGGTVPGARNVISGNAFPGIFIGNAAQRTLVVGNYIGTDPSGTLDFGNAQNGINLDQASNNRIGDGTFPGRNVISGNEFPGVYLYGPGTGNLVQGNFICTTAPGNAALGDGNGIVLDNVTNTTVGGTTLAARNVVAGTPATGIALINNASLNRIIGNYVGTDSSGTTAVPTLKGILLNGSPNNTIGGTGSGEGNVISGNTQYGIETRGATALGNKIYGNWIGSDPTGSNPVGNLLDGIVLNSSSVDVRFGNVIAFNGRAGVFDSTGSNNTIRFNVLRSNGALGIDLLPRGLTKNDLLDVDNGPNGLINFPYLDSAFVLGNVRRVHGRMEGKPNTTYQIDLFRNEACDPRHFGEAQEHLGEAVVVTDGAGNKSFTIDLPLPTVPPPTPYLTATATDATGSTSELSQCLCLDDRDGDGLKDCWEADGWGLDVNHDGVIDLDLFARTARADHKDLFVEVDAMNGYAPPQAALDMVVDAFANASNLYVNNPDGLAGINLQVERSDTSLPVVSLPGPWAEFAAIKDANFGTQPERESANAQHIRHAKRLVYRYALWARTFADSSSWGSAEPFDPQAGGDDLLVAIETIESNSVHAGVFMHELGHTLGLLHGGADTTNYKPNYYSVMNYLWQNPKRWQRPGSWRLDYSPVALNPLNEASLDERVGMNVPPGIWPVTVSIPFGNSNGDLRWTKLRPQLAVNWSGNGSDQDVGVVANLTDMFVAPRSRIDVLQGHADWSNLRYDFRRSRNFTLSGPSSFASTAPMLLAGEIEPELGPVLNAMIDALPPPRPEGWFVLDGQPDPGAPLVASNAGSSLYASYRNGQLYVATQGAPAADVHVVVTSAPPGALQPTPYGKGGQVAAWRALLAELGTPGLTAWTNPQSQDLSMIAVDSTNAFLEGVIDIELLDGVLPAQIFVAVGRYESGAGGTLQAQVPAGNGDGNLDANEFAAILVPTGVPGEPGGTIATVSLSVARPNPTAGESHLRLRLPTAGEVEVTVHDVTGRRVAVLAHGSLTAGEHELVWNARTGSGHRAPAGVYFVTVEVRGERQTARIVLLP